MNDHRLDLVALSLFGLVARAGNIGQRAALARLARLAFGAASRRITETVGCEPLEGTTEPFATRVRDD